MSAPPLSANGVETHLGAGRIGVFDSGVGGLTVLRALRAKLPDAQYIYLGDTARLPYGSKSQATVARFAVESARFLVEQGSEYLVIACNTASALALDEIRAAVPVPVLGVIETGANAARSQSRRGEVAVIATVATVASHAYLRACAERGVRAIEMACPLLVPLVEEGWIEHTVTREVMSIYLDDLQQRASDENLHPDALVLGCTHYPLLRAELEALVPEGMRVIDSAEATAEQVAREFEMGIQMAATNTKPVPQFFATDGVERFRELGSRFLNEPILTVELADLGG